MPPVSTEAHCVGLSYPRTANGETPLTQTPIAQSAVPPETGVTPGHTEYLMFIFTSKIIYDPCMCVFYNNTIVCITLQNDTFYY